MKKTYIVLFLLLLSVIPFSYAATSSDDKSLLAVDFISQTPDPVQPGNYVELRWRITNNGGKSDDYAFELRPEYPFSLDDQDEAVVQSKSIGTYESSEDGAVVYYRVRVAADALEGQDDVIKLAYYRKDGKGSEVIVEQPVRIESRQGSVEVKTVLIEPEFVSVGSKFNISVGIENLGSNFISDVKLTLDTEDTAFTPIGSANQKILKQINGGKTGYFTFEYFIDAKADIKVHAIPITLSYYDSLGRETNLTTKIGVPVESTPSYLENLQSTDIITGGQKGKVVVSISNIGKTDLNFVVLELLKSEDYTIISSPKEYLGNLESDDFETGQFEIYVPATEKDSVPLIFNVYYRDAYDKVYKEQIVLNNKIYTAEEAAQIGLISRGNGTGAVVVLVIIILVVAFFVWRHYKKKGERKKR